jgi:aminoglycoside 6-adenylyltransferase
MEMNLTDRGNEVIDRLTAWAEEHPLIRALVLESSRTNPRPTLDIFSDYDVLMVVADIDRFIEDESWMGDFGRPMVRFRDKGLLYGYEEYARLVLYDDGTKIDYTLWPVALLERVVQEPKLTELLDTGYRVLVDKDDLAYRLPPPTYTAHIPAKPTEREFDLLVEEFWWETIYVAKNLRRDQLLPAKYSLDVVMKLQLLVKLLEWRVEIDHDWSLKPGLLGKGLKALLDHETWSALADTYTGPDLDENWQALFKTTALFRRIAGEVADRLGYSYPDDLDQRVTAYLQAVRAVEI